MENGQKQVMVRRRSGVGTGTTSLLMIFTVLCFATLAMLSLSTALSSHTVQTRGAANAQNVAAAQGQAATQVAKLDEFLWQARQDAEDETDYYRQAHLLAASTGFTVDTQTNHITLVLPVDEESELVTELLLLPPGEEYRYQLVRQQTGLIGGWKPGDEGGLWSGQ